VVGESNGRHLELCGSLRQGRDAASPVEDRVLGVDVKMDELRLGHGMPILDLAQDRTVSARPPALQAGGHNLASVKATGETL
jgi:hypothetical protein